MTRTVTTKSMALALVLVTAGLVTPVAAADLTAMTLFAANDEGVVNTDGRWNSGPRDGAWDIFLYKGNVFDPGKEKPPEIQWLNNKDDNLIKIPLEPGLHTFTFHFEVPRSFPIVGMNLFLNGNHRDPVISALTQTDTDGPPYPDFQPNGATPTVRLPRWAGRSRMFRAPTHWATRNRI